MSRPKHLSNACYNGHRFLLPEKSMTETTVPTEFDLLLDTRGLNCPEPLMMLHQAVRKSQSGQVIHVMATDPSTTRDIPKFCMHLGHVLVSSNDRDQDGKKEYLFWVKKK